MSVYLDTNSANCFGGCGYLDSVRIVAKQLGITHAEARRELMTRYGIEALTPEEEASIRKAELLEKYVAECAGQLGPEHREALCQRGISDETISNEKIGLDNGQALSKEERQEAGIPESFVNTIIIPGIKNGKLIYAVGWNWQEIADRSKYTGLTGWPRPVLGEWVDGAVLTEGLFDYLSLKQADIPSICTLGAETTRGQKDILHKLNNLIILFDADTEGRTDARKLAGELFPKAKIAVLPKIEGKLIKDVNELLQAVGQERFLQLIREAIAQAKDPLDGLINDLTSVENVDRVVWLKDEALKLISHIGSGTTRDLYVEKLLPALKKHGITKKSLQTDISKAAKADTESGEGEKDSQQDILVALALAECELFKNDTREPFARVPMDDHKELYKCGSSDFKMWLTGKYYEATEKGPNSDSLNSAINTISAKVWREGQEHKLHNRVAEQGSSFWYDLVNKRWRAVQISPTGWDVVEPPILFQRFSHQQGQLSPAKQGKGNINKILGYVNTESEADKLLFLVTLVAAFIPDIAHPIFLLHGGEGTGKSTTSKVIRAIIDPSASPTCKCYEDRREFVQYMFHNYCVILENMSGISRTLSDTICSAVTGDGDSKRRLFSDDDDIIYTFKRVFVVNGINVVATRADLLRRCILFKLEEIPEDQRKEEKAFWADFAEDVPGILGGVLDTLVKAMKLHPTIKLSGLYDMSDFTRWGCAISAALGNKPEDFLAAYGHNRGIQNEEAVMGNPVSLAVTALMRGRGEWTGTPTALFEALTQVAESEKIDTRDRSWPKSSRSLGRKLNEAETALRKYGIRLVRDRSDDARAITFLRVGGNVVINVMSSEPSNGADSCMTI